MLESHVRCVCGLVTFRRRRGLFERWAARASVLALASVSKSRCGRVCARRDAIIFHKGLRSFGHLTLRIQMARRRSGEEGAKLCPSLHPAATANSCIARRGVLTFCGRVIGPVCHARAGRAFLAAKNVTTWPVFPVLWLLRRRDREACNRLA